MEIGFTPCKHRSLIAAPKQTQRQDPAVETMLPNPIPMFTG
ncbi:Protein of unknown function [Pyronema omphalodes CBS 100304]|uniref:Uncharacterized protein n=1 Tax=Pyronema omphalodes (strain CBS 100304) TaxID=1076935 RepID=U4LBL0_PYROM|nr:Protein of unknown function [Pyronema omphalodes CBS 100304]